MKRDSWFRLNRGKGTAPGRFADMPNADHNAEVRLRQMKIGSFEEEDFKRTLKALPADRFGNKQVGLLFVKWESKQNAEAI